MLMKSLTVVLTVQAIEPCLGFWQKRLGFELTASVPDGDRMGFAMLVKDDVTIMYQTQESLRKDMPSLGLGEQELVSANLLYISVSSIDEIEKRLSGIEPVVPKRTTFYGATEIAVREPGGYLVAFAEHGEQ
jgi:uncharacterized glyoxalase superfamily protein PhnB